MRAAVQGGGHALVRLTKVKSFRRLWGRKRLPAFLDLAVVWSASPHDQIDPGLGKDSVEGRLIVIQAHPRGHRPQTLYLFTTLTDVQAYPPKRLLELYGWRWQVEFQLPNGQVQHAHGSVGGQIRRHGVQGVLRRASWPIIWCVD